VVPSTLRRLRRVVVLAFEDKTTEGSLCLELTGFRGLFPLCGERSTNGKEAPPILSAGLPA
jgi:hypothetical protein